MSIVRFRRVACGARIWIADGFCDGQEIAELLALAGDGSAHGGGHDETGRYCELPVTAGVPATALSRRIAAVLGFAGRPLETLRFRSYGVGEFHPPHLDCYEEDDGSRLVATAMLCLVAPEAGGETVFPDARPAVALAPRAGRLAVWLNYGADGEPDPASRHEALAVLGGEKTTLTAFVYAHDFGEPAFAAGLVADDAIAGVRVVA